MPRQGLGKESILQAAIALIEEKGIAQFSMGELAKRLNVKPARMFVDGKAHHHASKHPLPMVLLVLAQAIGGEHMENRLHNIPGPLFQYLAVQFGKP